MTEGHLFRPVNRGDQVCGYKLSEKVFWQMLKTYVAGAGLPDIAPHDLRRTTAKLCRAEGGELEQIQLLLGLSSVQTTERYPGTKQDLAHAPNDALRTRFTFDPAIESDPVWSPDGRTIFFASNREGRGSRNLYRKSADGTGVEELLYRDKLTKTPSGVSPDGKYLLYVATRDLNSTLQDLWVLPLEGERKPLPIVQTAFAERLAQFSPDGRWIAYESNESGRSEIFAAPFSGTNGASGGKRQISTSGGQEPRWRRDGKEIFYVEPSGRLMAAEVSVKGANLEAGTVNPLFGPIRTGAGIQYDVSADGQRFLAIVPPEESAGEPLTLVQNWTTSLKK